MNKDINIIDIINEKVEDMKMENTNLLDKIYEWEMINEINNCEIKRLREENKELKESVDYFTEKCSNWSDMYDELIAKNQSQEKMLSELSTLLNQQLNKVFKLTQIKKELEDELVKAYRNM